MYLTCELYIWPLLQHVKSHTPFAPIALGALIAIMSITNVSTLNFKCQVEFVFCLQFLWKFILLLVLLSTINANAYKTNTTIRTKHKLSKQCHSPMDTNNKMDYFALVIHTMYNSLMITLQFTFWTQNHNFMMFCHPMHWASNEIITLCTKNYYHTFTINSLHEHKSLASRCWNLIKSHGNSK